MPPAGMMSRSKLKNVDFYRKIPKDMTEGTIPGSVISLVASVVIGMLLISEISTYITPAFNTRVVVDRSLDGDLMRINFNVSFPALSCEFASVDVGDAMGLNRYNLTKTVFKRPIDSNLNPLGPIQWERGEHKKDPKHADDLQVDKAAALVKYHGRQESRHSFVGQLLRPVVSVEPSPRPGVESRCVGSAQEVPEDVEEQSAACGSGLHETRTAVRCAAHPGVSVSASVHERVRCG